MNSQSERSVRSSGLWRIETVDVDSGWREGGEGARRKELLQVDNEARELVATDQKKKSEARATIWDHAIATHR